MLKDLPRDNDLKHTSKSTKAWFQKEGLENLWWDLKKVVSAQKPNNIRELETFAYEEWVKTPQERCQMFVAGYTSHL